MAEQTIQGARAAFPTGNPYLRLREARGPIDTNPAVAALVSHTGRPAAAPAQRAFITVMPCAAGLSDVPAAAVRARIDGKEARALDVTAPGVDASVVSAFRPRLITGHAEHRLFETLLTRLRDQGLLKATGRHRPDAPPGLAAIHTLKRREGGGETRRQALNGLAPAAPAWRRAWVPAVGFARYRPRCADNRLPPEKPARYARAEQIGTAGRQWLGGLDDPATPAWRRELPAVQTLRWVWLQQVYATPAGQPVRWRRAADLPPAPLLISSPDAPEARSGKTRQTAWTGDQGQGTEPWADETPNLSTAGTTTPAPTADGAIRPSIQAHLAVRRLTPRAQLVDAGDGTADHLLTSRTAHGRALRGPVAADQRWQGQAKNGFAAANVGIAWEAKHAIGPPGQRRVGGRARPERHGHATVRIACRTPGGAACASRAECTRAATAPRAFRIRARDHDTGLQAARARPQTDAFKKADARRAGVEGTRAQGTRTGDLRRSRDIGLVKTRLMHLRIAAALHCMRVAAWLAAIPRAQPRPSAFAAPAVAS
jgi:transposase